MEHFIAEELDLKFDRINATIESQRVGMTDPKKPRVQRIAIFFYALSSAGLVTLSVVRLFSSLTIPVLIFVGSFIASLFVWNWILFVRRTELNKKLPISSKELHSRTKEFYDSLPR
jgi:hypothetical protein